MIKFNSALFALLLISCSASSESDFQNETTGNEQFAVLDTLPAVEPLYCNERVEMGAEQTDVYFPLLENLRVGIVGNQSAKVGETHLVDTLIASGINVVKVFSPEHGFRGTADAGEKVATERDEKTGLEIISLYGKNRKPSPAQLTDVDVLIFDIQDVGVRFYTYISTLHYVMEAAAENGKKVIVLDRPNPNGHYVDGPVLKDGHSSFVGMHPVPVVHGMTVGEYAQMINGEKWLAGEKQCDLQVIPCEGWTHADFYELPIAPSPNLPNMTAVYLYPSLCFFEGTVVSIGRGTDYPFQVIGHPDYVVQDSTQAVFQFVPAPNVGAKSPKLEGKTCFGVDLHETDVRMLREQKQLDLSYLVEYYQNLKLKEGYFLSNNFIDLLAGTSDLRKQILKGMDLEAIRESWAADLDAYQQIRSKYLIYDLD